MAVQFSRTTRALSADSSHAAMLLWLVAGLLLAAWGWWFAFGSVTVYELSTHARVEVQQAAHPLSAVVSGRIATTTLAIGQPVQAGQVLVELDDSNARLRLQEEQARLAGIPPRIDSLNKEIAIRTQARVQEQQAAAAATQGARFRLSEAQAASDFARINEQRLKDESEIGSVARIEAMRALAEARKLAASRDALGSDIVKLDSDAANRASQSQAQIENLHRTVVSLQGDMASSRATIERLEQEIERHRIRAPVAGLTGDVAPLRVGSYVGEGQRLAAVVPEGAFVVVADFPPAAAFGRIHAGQSARLRLDGFPWAQFGTVPATVSRVGTEIRDNLVRIELTPSAQLSPGVTLQHGLPGSIEVSVDTAAPAVLLLRAAGKSVSRPAYAARPAGEDAR